MTSDAHVLETLYAARALLADEREEFDFYSYSSCACGFIYLAAEGRRGGAGFAASSGSPVYAEAIVAAARALGATDDEIFVLAPDGPLSWGAARFVSYWTIRCARLGGEAPGREHAAQVVGDAIRALESANEAARLRVLEDAFAAPAALEPAVV